MYKKLALITIGAVFFLILIGGIVRATGSGMGCPDWPKCFGSWVPPTSASQLPDDYKEIFGKELKGEVEFNVYKTWTEYINRLAGVLIGFLIFATLIASILEYRGKDKRVIFYSVLAFVLVGFEGWLGSKVVSMELSPTLVTVHMLLAILVVFMLILALLRAYAYEGVNPGGSALKADSFMLGILLALSTGQLVLGTQVREMVDEAYLSGLDREMWVSTLDGKYYVHIVLAFIILGLNIWYYVNKKNEAVKGERIFLGWMLALVILEFAFGGVLGLMNIPAFAQPIHLTLGTMIMTVQFVLLMLNREEGV